MDHGSMAENIVAVELIRRYGKDNIFYWKGKGEVDFVVGSGDERQMIQVCWDMEDQKTRMREIKALIEAEKELGRSRKMILSFEKVEMDEGVEVNSIWEWLVEKNKG
jgi:predicted AAA+ superfamily ATPase